MDFGVGVSIVPVIVGLVVLSARLGMPTVYETPLAVCFGLAISVGYALAAQVPGGTVLADATLRGVGIGLTSAGLIGSIRRLAHENGAGRG
jgi:hypothetical protein